MECPACGVGGQLEPVAGNPRYLRCTLCKWEGPTEGVWYPMDDGDEEEEI